MYEKASGQAMNFGKSGIICNNNVTPKFFHAVSCILGVSGPLNMDRYLGLPSLIEKNKKAIFAHLRDRI